MEQKLVKVLMDIFQISEKETRQASMTTVLNWDSLTHIELMMTLEEEFGIPRIIPDEIVLMVNIESIKSVLRDKGVEI